MESGQLSYQQGESLGRDNHKIRLKTKKKGSVDPWNSSSNGRNDETYYLHSVCRIFLKHNKIIFGMHSLHG